MRLSLPFAVLLSLAGSATAQSTSQPSGTTANHRSGASRQAAHPAPRCPVEQSPALPAGIPPATGTLQTPIALRTLDITPGTGPEVATGQFLTVQYTGWLASDGTKFDSSADHPDTPFSFQLGAHRVIPGWDYGLVGMHVGGKRRLFIPWIMAYGLRGQGAIIPPQADLIFDVEVVAAGDQLPTPGAQPTPSATQPGTGSGTTPQ